MKEPHIEGLEMERQSQARMLEFARNMANQQIYSPGTRGLASLLGIHNYGLQNANAAAHEPICTVQDCLDATARLREFGEPEPKPRPRYRPLAFVLDLACIAVLIAIAWLL